MVLHTSTITGEMKRLVAGGQSSWEGPPMGLTRIYHSQVRVAGIAADSHRLYVLRWSAEAVTLQGRAGFVPSFDKGTYHLLVFRPSDGRRLHELEVKRPDNLQMLAVAPASPPADTSGKGPLRLAPGSVSCFGVTFRFAGEKLLKREPGR
jgi:hypothetical protein